MAQITFMEAVWNAIQEEMRSDPRVLIIGQDLEYEATSTWREFGAERVRNAPISEAGFVGAAIGAALTGLRPIVQLGCSTFLYSAMDQVVNQAAKSRYMFGGQANIPLVIRAPVIYSMAAAAHHSDRPWGLFAQAPGLKIVVAATAYDAKGLLKAAIRDGNPVLFFEDLSIGAQQWEVPEGDYTVPIGVADIKRQGSDVTLVAVAASVQQALLAAESLAHEGISAEVVDVRTVVPLDRKTILDSVAKTGRLVVIDPAPAMCGLAAEIAATAAEHLFDRLVAPIARLTAPDVPVPFSPELERLMYPTAPRIVAAARAMCRDKKHVARESWSGTSTVTRIEPGVGMRSAR